MKRFLALLASLALLLAACGKTSSSKDTEALPDAQTLLQKSVKAMAGLSTVSFDLKVDGDLTGFSLRDATGSLTADGKVSATAHLVQGDRLVEYKYILVDNASYLKGPTGGFQEVPSAIVDRFFNPTALLNGQKSLAKALAQGTKAHTDAHEKVNGVDCYRIKLKIDPQKVEGLSLLATGSSQEATIWVSKADGYLIKAVLPFKSGKDKTVVTASFSDFNKDVNITAPA